jgi:hypothetical protein
MSSIVPDVSAKMPMRIVSSSFVVAIA